MRDLRLLENFEKEIFKIFKCIKMLILMHLKSFHISFSKLSLEGWGQFVPTLEVETSGGRQKMSCANY
jgi:hypothetical protein